METDTLPKLCHVCGVEVEPDREWQYMKSGLFDPLRARCKRCALKDRIEDTQRGIRRTLQNLLSDYQALVDLYEQERAG